MIDIIAETKEKLRVWSYSDHEQWELDSEKRGVKRPPPIDRQRQLPAPLTEDQVAALENTLGFKLPDTLKRLYIQIADGQFGPGGGLYGGQRAVDEYLLELHSPPESFRNEQQWPEGLVPICLWGCSIMSAVFCTKPNAPVVRIDINYRYEEIAHTLPEEKQLPRYDHIWGCSWLESPSFDRWILDWVRDQEQSPKRLNGR